MRSSSSVPFSLQITGSADLFGQVTLAAAEFDLLAGTGFTPLVYVNAGIGADPSRGLALEAGGVLLAQVKAQVALLIRGSQFNLYGAARINALGLDGQEKALASTKGLAACATFGGNATPDARAAALRSAPASGDALVTAAVRAADPIRLQGLSAVQRRRAVTRARRDLSAQVRAARAIRAATRRSAARITRRARGQLATLARRTAAAERGVRGRFARGSLSTSAAARAVMTPPTAALARASAIRRAATAALNRQGHTQAKRLGAVRARALRAAVVLRTLGGATSRAALRSSFTRVGLLDDVGSALRSIGRVFTDTGTTLRSAAAGVGSAIARTGRQVVAGAVRTATQLGGGPRHRRTRRPGRRRRLPAAGNRRRGCRQGDRCGVPGARQGDRRVLRRRRHRGRQRATAVHDRRRAGVGRAPRTAQGLRPDALRRRPRGHPGRGEDPGAPGPHRARRAPPETPGRHAPGGGQEPEG